MWIQTGFLIPPHPLTNLELQKYYQNEPRLNGIYSRDNLPNKIKDGAYVINLDEYSDIGTHWIVLYALNTCFFNKHDVYRHIQAQAWLFFKHVLSIILSLAKYYYVKYFSG